MDKKIETIKDLQKELSAADLARLEPLLGDAWPSFVSLLKEKNESKMMPKLDKLTDDLSNLGIMSILRIRAAMSKKQMDLITNLL